VEFVFIAGQVGVDENGKLAGEFRRPVRRTANIEAALTSCGAG
jgi:enamine deaminase RidA (YjgF/YER057c/UK114 family)